MIFFIYVLTYGLSTAYCYYSLQVTSSKSVLMEGENLTITCEINIRTNQSFYIVWIKYMPPEYGLAPIEIEIGTNDHLNSLFSSTGRYASWYRLKDPKDLRKVKFFLHIAKIQSGDAGSIGCKVPNQIDVLKNIVVVVPVRSLQLLSHDLTQSQTTIYEDRQVVEVKEGEMRRVTCNITGVFPEPDVHVTIGGRDITYNFITMSNLVRSGNVSGLENVYYSVILKCLNFEFEYDMDGGELVCSASTPYYFSFTDSKSITLLLTGYRPRFNCARLMHVEMYQNDVIICRIRSMPAPTFSRIYWSKRTKEVVQMLPGESNAPYTFIATNNTFELKLVKVFPQMLRSYFFEAKNEYGETVHQIDLVQISILNVQALTSFSFSLNNQFLNIFYIIVIIVYQLISIVF